MKKTLHIAHNTFREAIRDKVLYVIVFFSAMLMAASQGLGWVSVGEETQIVQHFSLAAISLFGALIAVFVGTGLIYKEIDKRTIYTILSKPVHRWQFIFGKFLGLMGVLSIVVFGMGAIALAFILYSGYTTPTSDGGLWIDRVNWLMLAQALLLIYFELMVVVALAVLFSTMSSPVLAAIFTFCAYLLGQASPSLQDLVELDPPEISYLLRDRDVKNWQLVAKKAVDGAELNKSSPGKVIHSKLLPVAQKVLEDMALGRPVSDSNKERMLGSFNTILEKKNLYDSTAWDVGRLPPKAKELFAIGLDKLSQKDLIRFNRFLFEDAFPDGIGRGAHVEIQDLTKENLSPLVGKYSWLLKPFARGAFYVMPDLSHFQLRNRVVYGPPPKSGKFFFDGEIGMAMVYAICYSGAILCLSVFAFSRKKF